ncbi:MAG: putative ABC transporter permease [Clostridia bacterium]|nr:putative ABC transporter permease [Clostridia bacterium]
MDDMKEKRTFKIAGISIWRIFSYFIVYCVLGFIVETIYGFVTKGTLESRQGFLYGPVCPIYGLGAVVMILSLQPLKKNNYTLFFGGCIIGAIIEYLISYLAELILNVNWWDYSDRFLNINGRICLTYSLFWGLLALYLMKHLNPLIDKIFNKLKTKISTKWLKAFVAILIIFLLIDGLLTTIGVKIFFARTVYTYNLNIENKDKYIYDYKQVLEKDVFNKIQEKIFSNKKMIRTFPNLKLKANNR